jgi:hypothetical protein
MRVRAARLLKSRNSAASRYSQVYIRLMVNDSILLLPFVSTIRCNDKRSFAAAELHIPSIKCLLRSWYTRHRPRINCSRCRDRTQTSECTSRSKRKRYRWQPQAPRASFSQPAASCEPPDLKPLTLACRIHSPLLATISRSPDLPRYLSSTHSAQPRSQCCVRNYAQRLVGLRLWPP